MIRSVLQPLCVGLGMAAFAAVPAKSQSLIVPVIEKSVEDWDTCGLGEVSGLKDGGDGFLAVRAGPDSKFEKLDELKNGDRVFLFDQHGDWYGILYGISELDCGPLPEARPAARKGAKPGWVHSNWVRVVAG
ncbi:SH3 domain-containing protein [Roseibium sp.]|uniref:SH3 domain-containing protein n=1 Tax=Roseibium sp. TaxID=1936156 RepID=UPI003B504789